MSRARKTASFAGGLRGAAIGLAGALGIAVLVFGPALRAEAQAPAPAAPPDLRFQEIDPKLYATARAYFPADAGAAAPKRIFRLTRDQLDATVATLLPGYFPGSIKATMARDPLQTNYEYAELLSLNAANLGALTAWVGEIAARVRKNPSGVVDCARVNNSEACLKTEARRFVERALRGDVTEEKLDRLVKFYLDGVRTASFAQATSELVELVLNSPDFLFRKELDVNESHRLAPAQLLQSVTYTIADAPPETLALASQAADQYLHNGDAAAATIAAIVASKPAREKIVRFFKSWLEIKEPGEFTISQKVFPEFSPEYAVAMLGQADRLLRAQLAKPAPSLKDITQAIQLVSPPPPGSAAAAEPPPPPRFGIFAQPAVLASHSGPTDTRLIKRGVFWARKVMCMDLQPPPPDVHAAVYAEKVTTERRRVEQSTARPACAGCHKVINPFGFMLESYDALGRFRSKDNGHPVDPSIEIDFLDERAAPAADTAAALRTFTGSAMFKQCFVRQLFRFYMGRREEASDDPLLRRMFFEFAHNDSQDILTMVYLLSSSDRIVRRQ